MNTTRITHLRAKSKSAVRITLPPRLVDEMGSDITMVYDERANSIILVPSWIDIDIEIE